MIRFNDVSKIYHVEVEVKALYHASMQIEDGEFVSIIGPSGSGKSTMMNIIGCLDMADEGQYLLDGQAIEEYTETELARIRNHKIGFIFQSFNLIGNMTAQENIELPLIYQKLPKSVRKERAEEALEKVRLKGRGLHKPNQISGGQQREWRSPGQSRPGHLYFWRMSPPAIWIPAQGAEIMGLFHELHDGRQHHRADYA